MDISGERKQFLQMNHGNAFFADGSCCFFKIQSIQDRNVIHIIVSGCSSGNKCLENLTGILSHHGCHRFPVRSIFSVPFVCKYFEPDTGPFQNTDRIGLIIRHKNPRTATYRSYLFIILQYIPLIYVYFRSAVAFSRH